MSHPTLVNLDPNEYIERIRYYPFAVNLGRCTGKCNTLNDLSKRMYSPNKKEDLT